MEASKSVDSELYISKIGLFMQLRSLERRREVAQAKKLDMYITNLLKKEKTSGNYISRVKMSEVNQFFS